MKKRIFLVPFLVIFVASACIFPLGPSQGSQSAGGLDAPDVKHLPIELPMIDLDGEIPSAGAAALQALVEYDPTVSELVDAVTASERAALVGLRSDLQAEIDAQNEQSSLGTEPTKIGFSFPSYQSTLKDAVSVPAEKRRLVLQEGSDGPGNAGVIISLLSGVLGDMVTGSISEQFNISKSNTETEDGATTTMSTEMGRNADGTTVFQMGMKTEKTVNGKKVKIEFDSKVDGTRCPNAAGQVSFTVKTRTSAYSGESGYTQDLTSHVRAEVDDNAEIVNTTIDVEQATRQVKDGREIYIETATTFKHAGEEINKSEESNFRVVRASSKAKSSDQGVSNDGLLSAWIMGEVSLAMAKEKWMNGACVKIEAQSPGKVEVSSVTDIPVKVIHKFEGGEVKSKLTVELSGKESVSPLKLAQTPGTLRYTAPGKNGEKAVIDLTATSKRGKAKLALDASTGEPSYQVNDAQYAGFSWETKCIPALDKPYQISWTSPQGSAKFQFSPNSALAGKADYFVVNTLPDYKATIEGSGSYIISVLSATPDGSPTDMSIDIEGQGTITQCVGGNCTTMDSPFEQSVPIIVSDATCE